MLVCLGALQRVADIKAKGGKVEPQSVSQSVLLKTGKVSSKDAIVKPEAPNPNGNFYDHAGKDVVNAKRCAHAFVYRCVYESTGARRTASRFTIGVAPFLLLLLPLPELPFSLFYFFLFIYFWFSLRPGSGDDGNFGDLAERMQKVSF